MSVEPHGGLFKPTLSDIGAVPFYEKVLSGSDLNSGGRVSIPKGKALEFFPDVMNGPLDLQCKDTLGNEHNLRITTFVDNKTRLFALEGIQQLQEVYELKAGSVLQIGSMPNGEKVVCGRPHQEGTVLPRSKLVVTLDRSKRKKSLEETDTVKGRTSDRQSWRASVPSQVSGLPGRVPGKGSVDGIFREAEASDKEPGISLSSGCWQALVMIQGQPLEAFFSSEEAAQEACLAIGIEV